VIVVTVNYRLGILGFLAHPDLDGEGHAFSWISMRRSDGCRTTSRPSGADPGNVTIFGESSGGTSVMSHIVSPASAGLFQHAISMSGSAIILEWPNF